MHGLISIPNDILLQESGENANALNAFSVADRWIERGVNSLCMMLLKTGLVKSRFQFASFYFSESGWKDSFCDWFRNE